MRYLPTAFLVLAMCFPAPTYAFDYLEHLWFTDDACRRVQEKLAASDAPDLDAPFAALAIVCPASWEKPYCEDGDKTARGHLNQLPEDSTGYSATLGDFSALGDHVSRQGPIRNLPRAGRYGLVHDMLRWLTAKPGPVGGTAGQVAKAACKTRELDDFASTTSDVNGTIEQWEAAGQIETVSRHKLGALQRSLLNRGPHDPAMKYSFDNPHYLDLVLRNHHHFGEAAFGAWNGFHATSTQMRTSSCAKLIAVDAREAEDLADHVPGYEKIDWDDIPEDELTTRVCAMLADVVGDRLLSWSKVAPEELTEPLRDRLVELRSDSPVAVTRSALFLDEVLVDILSLVFEGTGLHYLQDGLAGGHLRTIRSREALLEVRYDHDEDNRAGVAAVIHTAAGDSAFVAWGDGYMLGYPPADECLVDSAQPEVVSTCLLRHQRALISLASAASLTDWALGGVVYAGGADCEDDLQRTICIGLPLGPAAVAGTPQPVVEETVLRPGSLPVPPPRYSYESLSTTLGYAPWEQTPFLALRFAAYSELDAPAHWLTSWQIQMESRFGDPSKAALTADAGFGFHYRFYARVMLDLVPVMFVGLRDFGDQPDFFAGVSPRIGLTGLPEGFLKIPVEFSLYIDQPIVLFSADGGFFNEAGDQLPRAGVGFGLAFSH